jgi:2-polyprenyl-6-hydroxyphenyl methylase/3-demethylubiquinone-9 3-methyltransferase
VLRRKDILRFYRQAPRGTRLYLRVKLRICPLLRLEELYPKAGKVVDLGCGNGTFSNILKLGGPEREVLGVDLDPRKVEAARAVHAEVVGLEFREGDIAAMDYPSADVYSLVDVLYLIPFDRQDEILRKCHAALRPGGTLVVKEMDTRPRWKYAWNFCQETLAVKVVGFTLGSRFYFRSAGDHVRALETAGFKADVVRLDRGQAYPHIAIRGLKGK